MRSFWFAVLLMWFFIPATVVYAGDAGKLDDFFEDYAVAEDREQVPDPLYWFNYTMYTVNDKLYLWALEPVAKGYKAVAPRVVRRGVKNFFDNILFPVRCANSLLQGKFKGAGREVGIFFINSTAGCLGFSRPAQEVFNLENSREDLGQTLGTWQLGQGFYLVLPLLGPSTLRDALGTAGDSFLDPVTYVDPSLLAAGIKTVDTVNSLSFKIGDYQSLKEASFDPYDAMKNGYLQSRQSKVQE
ncbi:MAG: VacJ family lipoprotein [Desulfobacteraceae bacterium]